MLAPTDSSDPHPSSPHHQIHSYVIWKAFLDIVVNLGVLSVDLMAEQLNMVPEGSSDKARWTPLEITAVVDYLHEHRAERGDSGNFKEATYNATAVRIRPHFNGVGAVKTGKMVAYKWGTVSDRHYLLSFCYVLSDTY